jgi:hypothetical protein
VKYICPFRSPAGEVHDVVVELTPDEIGNCARNLRGGNGPGAPNGPLPRAYAWRRATRLVLPEFEPVIDQIRLVQ